MLETVKTYISELPSCSFSQFFRGYVLQVQDLNIEEELKFFEVRNLLNPNIVASVIQKTYEGLVKK